MIFASISVDPVDSAGRCRVCKKRHISRQRLGVSAYTRSPLSLLQMVAWHSFIPLAGPPPQPRPRHQHHQHLALPWPDNWPRYTVRVCVFQPLFHSCVRLSNILLHNPGVHMVKSQLKLLSLSHIVHSDPQNSKMEKTVDQSESFSWDFIALCRCMCPNSR